MSATIVPVPAQLEGNQGREISIWRPPAEVLAEATTAAKALQSVLAGKKNPVMFNKEQYLEFEDWQVLAQFFHLSVGVESTEFVEFGAGIQGFKATAVLKNDVTGEVISRAESMCLNNEDNWGMVAEYEWKDVLDANGKKQWDALLFGGKGGYVREKVKTGEKAKPLFQIMSMSQTRACSKACRNKLSWVVVLAGYKPTPIEEMVRTDDQGDWGNQQEPPKTARGKKTTQATSQTTHREKVVCASCGATDSHAPSCKFHPKNVSSGGQQAETSQKPPSNEGAKQEVKGEVMPKTVRGMYVIKSGQITKSGKGLELTVTNEDNKEGKLYVWHKHLQTEPCDLKQAVGKLCDLELSPSVKKNTQGEDVTFYSVEHVHQIGSVPYLEDKPAQSPTAAEVGFDEPTIEDW